MEDEWKVERIIPAVGISGSMTRSRDLTNPDVCRRVDFVEHATICL